MLRNPSSRYELSIWHYFNSSRLFLPHEHLPVLSLPEGVGKGVNQALEVLLQIMNRNERQRQSRVHFVPPYHLFDGFVLMEYSSGVQYNLHLSVHRQGRENPIEFFGNVFLPFHGAGMATYQRSTYLLRKVVHMVINVGTASNLEGFLQRYRDICIVKNKLKMHLHISMFGTNTKARLQVADLVAQHPREPITSYDLGGQGFSHSVGYEHVIKNLLDDDLVILMDHSLFFTKEFIWHVLMNAVKGHQVYMPIFFSFYKPELVSRYLHKTPMVGISVDTGFFLRYNYQVVGIYKSDYVTVTSGAGTFNAGGGARNDDIRFVDKLVSSDLYIMRALEPYLRRKYQSRTCASLSGIQRQVCENSKADAIGSKRMLASLLIDHKLLNT